MRLRQKELETQLFFGRAFFVFFLSQSRLGIQNFAEKPILLLIFSRLFHRALRNTPRICAFPVLQSSLLASCACVSRFGRIAQIRSLLGESEILYGIFDNSAAPHHIGGEILTSSSS